MSAPSAPDRQLLSAPAWRREPYRPLFALGALLLWAGIAPWLLYGLGGLPALEGASWMPGYESIAHSIIQVQGFLTAFAAGFLLTMIPRRTATAPPGPVTMWIAILGPIGSTVCAWMHAWAASQLFWYAVVAALVVFALKRFKHAGRRPPASFVWVPMSLLIGAAGSGLIAAYGVRPSIGMDWHDLGRGMLLQGTFLGLIVGVGGLALPLMTRKEAPPDLDPDRPGILWLHGLAALALVGTFVVEIFVSRPLGYGLRALLVLALLLGTAKLHRLPTQPGLHRRLMWLAAWALPIGFALAALWPSHRQAGLHVVFIAGFALMTLSVGMHVSLAHGGAAERLGKPSALSQGFGIAMFAALAARLGFEFEPARFWLGWSAALLLTATLFWAARLITGLRRT